MLTLSTAPSPPELLFSRFLPTHVTVQRPASEAANELFAQLGEDPALRVATVDETLCQMLVQSPKSVFRIHVYDLQSACVVEFQRRKGCTLEFHSIFAEFSRRILHSCELSGPLRQWEDEFPETKSLGPLLGYAIGPPLQHALGPLLDMLESAQPTARCEGAQILDDSSRRRSWLSCVDAKIKSALLKALQPLTLKGSFMMVFPAACASLRIAISNPALVRPALGEMGVPPAILAKAFHRVSSERRGRYSPWLISQPSQEV